MEVGGMRHENAVLACGNYLDDQRNKKKAVQTQLRLLHLCLHRKKNTDILQVVITVRSMYVRGALDIGY